ncbi:hypothetical protein [Lichenihabitans psoromatis]|uniref:hypothetical protein n=1 Tax=Lichenihabitans psoromatis TaxID=2528642 RepID=UPI0010384DFB|nr:hypothetical protein [Lichenihabitans psoromatis]
MSRQLIKLAGVNFSGTGFTTIAPSAYELAINKMAGLRFWLSPEARFEGLGSGKGLRDRISLIDGTQFNAYGYALGTSLNGQPSLNIAYVGSPSFTRQAVVFSGLSLAFLAAGYTKVVVALETAAAANYMPLIASNDKVCDLTIGYNGRVEINHGTATANNSYSTAATDYRGAAHVFLLSWDATTNVPVLEVDGVAKAMAFPTIAAPVPASITKLGVGGIDTGANQFGTGSIGETFMFDRPLASTANLQAKFALYAQLNAKYGFTLPTA